MTATATANQPKVRLIRATYLELSDGCPDPGKADVLLAQEVGVDPALGVPDDQEGAADVTLLHLLVEVVVVDIKPCKGLEHKGLLEAMVLLLGWK